jgi:hypothetical protein
MEAYSYRPTTIDVVPVRWADAFLRERPELQVVDRQHLDAYADRLVDIGKELQAIKPHRVVVPLRGGLKPWLQLDVMTEMRHCDGWLPYTQGANNVATEQVRHYLNAFIAVGSNTPHFRIAILDTAESGHSSRELAKVVKELRAQAKGNSIWEVHFFLVFVKKRPQDRWPSLSGEIEPMSAPGITFRLHPFSVPHLLVEDWNEALGIRTRWVDGHVPRIEFVPSNGRMALREYDGSVRVFEAERLDRFTDALLGKSVSDGVVSAPGFRHVGDVWPNYLPPDAVPPAERRESQGGE